MTPPAGVVDARAEARADPGRPTPAPRPQPGSRPWWAGWLPIPTVRSAGLVAALGLAALVLPASPGADVLLGATLLVVVADASLAPAPWRLGVARRLPAVVPLDGEARVTWQVANPIGRPLRVSLADELTPSLGAETRRVALRVPARGRARASTPIRPTRRGTFRPVELTVRVTGPLGLAARQAPRRLPGRVQVHPRFRARRAVELRLRRARLLEQGLRSVRGRGGGTEFEALRDYVEGDDYRHVDWPATARMGHPIVRTYRAERNQTVLILLDTGRVTAGLVEGVPRLDHGMDAALALATVAIRSGDRSGLIAFGAGVRAVVVPRRDTAQVGRISTALHSCEPELAESDYRGAFVGALARFRRRTLLVVITELAAEAATETLVPALPMVAAHHAVVVASVRDPALDAWVAAGGAGPSESYRAAAAAALIAERRRAVARLTSVGARVVDAAPGELAARLCDAYLEVKARGSV